ncbi:cysteine dioxygenase [Gemmata sp.]|uniref:cysteine dioxygenase n=1 Tax=Gemmata sp. TaxID=1914242 RepID=UPI003F6F6FEE
MEVAERTVWELADLERYAAEYEYRDDELPVHFSAEPYTRISLHRDESMEVVLICFAAGQTSSVHDHRGSSCVIRVVNGMVLETLFEKAAGTTLAATGQHYLAPGDVSGLAGDRVHQLSNVDTAGTVLLNFYSPPFQT